MRQQFRAPAAYILAGFVGILCTVFLFLFPSHSIQPVWTGYRVLIVPLEKDESAVIDLLAKQGIGNLATEMNSRIQNSVQMAPVVPFLKAKNDALTVWFRNTDANKRYIYLEESPFLESKIDAAFKGANFAWNLERADGIHLLPVILAILFLSAAVLFCTDRLFLLVSGLPFVLFSLECNQYPVFIAVVCVLYLLFMFENLLEPDRPMITARQRRFRLEKHPLSLIPLVPVIAALVAGGFHTAIMFFDTLCVSSSLWFLALSGRNAYRRHLNLKRLHPAFRPNLMHPVTIGKKWPERKTLLFMIPVPLMLIAGLFFFGPSSRLPRTATGTGAGQELYIPSPTGYTSRKGIDIAGYSELISLRKDPTYPDLAWFISVRWNLETAPWRRVQDSVIDPVPGTTADTMEYETDKNGMISGKKDTMNTFDLSFIRKTVSGTVTPLEKMLISQGRYVMVDLARHAK